MCTDCFTALVRTLHLRLSFKSSSSLNCISKLEKLLDFSMSYDLLTIWIRISVLTHVRLSSTEVLIKPDFDPCTWKYDRDKPSHQIPLSVNNKWILPWVPPFQCSATPSIPPLPFPILRKPLGCSTDLFIHLIIFRIENIDTTHNLTSTRWGLGVLNRPFESATYADSPPTFACSTYVFSLFRMDIRYHQFI
jgi:hypothetical protein